MHGHRFLEDGTMRDADNWQKGLPNEWLMESLGRHYHDVWNIMRGYYVFKEKIKKEEHTYVFINLPKTIPTSWHRVTLDEAANGVRFNSEGLKFNYLTNEA
jgi:hypothetical protein